MRIRKGRHSSFTFGSPRTWLRLSGSWSIYQSLCERMFVVNFPSES